MSSVANTLVSFLLITLVGAFLASNLQHRNWIRQQQISSREKLIAELKSIFVELDNLMSRRLYKTRRLLYALRRFEERKFDEALKAYNDTINDWNEKRNSFQIRLVRVVNVPLAQDFEHDLSRRFIRIGSQLERLARNIKGGRKVSEGDLLTKLEIELDLLDR
jgi:hypothetical protein